MAFYVTAPIAVPVAFCCPFLGTGAEGNVALGLTVTYAIAFGVIYGPAYRWVGRMMRRPTVLPTVPPMAYRLHEVQRSLGYSKQMLDGLEYELSTRMRLLETRQHQLADYERKLADYEHIAAMTPAQKQAVDRMVADQFKRQGWQNLWTNIVLVVVGIGTGLLVNYIYDLLK